MYSSSKGKKLVENCLKGRKKNAVLKNMENLKNIKCLGETEYAEWIKLKLNFSLHRKNSLCAILT